MSDTQQPQGSQPVFERPQPGHTPPKPRGRKRGKKPTVPNESPRAKAVRLANYRVNACLFRLNQIGNLGAKTYDLSDAQKDSVCKSIEDTWAATKQRLYASSTKSEKFEIK